MIEKKLRRSFDVNNKKDVDTYRQFLVQSKWGTGGCPFELEYPFDNVPAMVDNKLIRYFLKIA